MKLKSSFHLIMGLVIVLGLLPALAVAAPSAAPATQQVSKIEDQLLDLFAVKGSADLIVRFAEQADLSPAYSMSWDARGEFVVNALTAAAQRSQAQAKAYLDGRSLTYQTFIAGNDLYVYAGDQTAAESLSALPEVSFIRAPRTYYVDPIISADPAPEATTDWGITDTKADQFWAAFGLKGEGIVVANIDTGVQWNHPALINQFKCAGAPTNPACWSDPSNICGAGGACDNNGHGTHTMGTMVAKDDPGLTYIAGMAPNAQWIACKGCESSSCSDTALNACADWILQPGGSTANRPHVVNNSWGGGGGDNWYQAKVQAWQAAGIFPAFSAGNSTGCGSMGSPGDYQESFATTGHDVNRNHAFAEGASAFGHEPYTKPNVSGPAVSVCSTVPTNSWSCGYSGTSMASPHSAGAVALLWSCNPSLIGQMAATFEALQDGADAPTPPNPSCGVPPDGEGTYQDGYGYLNIYQAGQAYCSGDLAFGNINGHVYDTGGQPIEGANVSASPGVAAGSGVDATTDPTGYYTMTALVGTYNVTASKTGYTPQTVSGVVVVTDTVTTQDFNLEFQGTWTQMPATCFDLTRIDAEFFPATGLIYILGGRGGPTGGDTISTIYSYNPATGECLDTNADMPFPISNYTINLVNNGSADVLCTFGGRGAAGTSILNVQCYNPLTNVATSVGNLPAAYTGYTPGGQAVVDNMVYVFGGFNSLAAPYELNRTDRYDPVANTFTQIGNLSLARSYLDVAVVDGKIYAFGGTIFDGTNLTAQTRAEVMADPGGAGTWNDASVADLPTATAEGRAWGYDTGSSYGFANQIVIAGGGQWPGDTLEALVYDIATNSYDYTFADLVNARRDHAGAFVPLCTPEVDDGLPGMWVFGGRQGVDTPPYMPPEFYPLPCATVPDASFTSDPTEGCAPLDVQFTDTSSGNPTEWAWDFGDGGTSTEQNPLHTYATAGTFVVTLTVTNAQGSDTVTGTITVNESPTAGFSWPAPVYIAEPVQFTDTSSGSPVAWLWETDDGYTYTVQNPQHTFYTVGSLLVTLTVTNAMDCADTIVQTVEVLPPTQGNFYYLPIVVRNY
jgi:Subtilase family/PKD domain/Carboxypeptidase regulatory-like domain/Kelch motif